VAIDALAGESLLGPTHVMANRSRGQPAVTVGAGRASGVVAAHGLHDLRLLVVEHVHVSLDLIQRPAVLGLEVLFPTHG
jgi:hypothetical protein